MTRHAVGSIIAALLGAVLAAAPAALRAQVLRGTVVESTLRRPLPGVVLSLLDSSGITLSSTLSNVSGTYRLRLQPSARRVRAQRIGFRPVEQPLAVGVDTLDITMQRLPTLLETRRVSAAACGDVRPDAAGTLSLIEQARAGLLAIAVARDQHPATVTVLTYDRSMEDSETSARMRVAVEQRTQTGRSFGAARDAADFVNDGFRGMGTEAGFFYAPDADVLLDDAFSSSYCFHLARPDVERPAQVGLAFSAASSRRGRVDVDGTLWVDTLARELREIEFRYVGLSPDEDHFRPGGRIHFRTMANGLVFVDRWSLLLVGAALDTLGVTRSGAPSRTRVRRFVHHSGGELARASWPDGTEWRGELGTVHLTALRRDGTPARDVLLEFRDTPYAVRTDSSGRATVTDLLPGPYSIIAPDSLLATIRLDIPTSLRFTSARDTVSRTGEVPTLADYVADRCDELKRGPEHPDAVYVLARVFTVSGRPIADARYVIRRRGVIGDAAIAWEVLVQNGRTGGDGLIPWCRGLGIDREYEIEVTGPNKKQVAPRLTLKDPVTIIPIIIP